MSETKIVIYFELHRSAKGEWQVRCPRLLPYPLWFKDREYALSYAQWLGRGYPTYCVVG